MSWFRKMTIGLKLGWGFGAVLALVVILGVFSLVQLSKINGSTVDIATNWLPSVRVIAELKFDAASLRRDTLNYIVATDKKQHYEDKINVEMAAISDDEKKYHPLISFEEERKLYQGFRDTWSQYLPVNAQMRELARHNKNAEA